MEQFFTRLFPSLGAGEFIEIRAISSARVQASFHSSIPSAIAECTRQSLGGANVYFGVTPRNNSSHGDKAGVSRVQALWIDLDAAVPEAINNFVFEPSIVVSSGRGYHAYWVLQESTTNWTAAESIMQAMAKRIGSDVSVRDVSRILRVPCTLNYKYEPPRPVTTVATRPVEFSLGDMYSATLLEDDAVERIITGRQEGFRSRSERDYSVLNDLVRAGMSDAGIRLLFSTRAVGDKYREDGDAYLSHSLETISKSIGSKDELPTDPDFLEKDDCYWAQTKFGWARVSTFTLDPKALVQDERGDTIVSDVAASGYTWLNVPFPKKSFGGVDAMLKALPVAAWQWLGSDKQVRLLLPYLMDKLRSKGLPKMTATSTIGRHGQYWVSTHQVFDSEREYSPSETPIVFVPTGREAPSLRYSFPLRDEYSALLRQLMTDLPNANLPSVVWPILGWFCATPFKTELAENGVRFPVLNVFGTRGSGKSSTLLRLFQPLLGYQEGRSYDANTTPFVLLSLLGSTNTVPVSFSEFRATGESRLVHYALLAYDTGHDPRGRADQTTQDYPLSAPFTVDGEDLLSDPAVKERTIAVQLSPEHVLPGSEAWKAFQELSSLPLQSFAGNYIRYTLTSAPKWNEAQDLLWRAINEPIPDRVRRNLGVVTMGLLHVREMYTRYGVEFPDLTPEFLRAALLPCLEQVVDIAVGHGTILADELIEDVINAISKEHTYAPFHYRYDDAQNILWFQLSTAMAWWLAKRRRENRSTLETPAIKAQLKERSQETSRGPGQYIVGRQGKSVAGSTKWMYGVDLTLAAAAGLDIPDTIAAYMMPMMTIEIDGEDPKVTAKKRKEKDNG